MNKLYSQQPFSIVINTVVVPTASATPLSTSQVHNLRIHLCFGKCLFLLLLLFLKANQKTQTTPNHQSLGLGGIFLWLKYSQLKKRLIILTASPSDSSWALIVSPECSLLFSEGWKVLLLSFSWDLCRYGSESRNLKQSVVWREPGTEVSRN